MAISMEQLSLLRQYRTDIAQFPRVSSEDVRHLTHSIITARAQQNPHLETQATHRLVEGHLGLVLAIAHRYRNVTTHLKFLDLVQEGNYGLLQAAQHSDFNDDGAHFMSYAIAYIRGAITSALPSDEAISINRTMFYQERAAGRLSCVRAMRPFSLDQRNDEKEEGDRYERITVPMPAAVAPPREMSEKRARVEALLAKLSAREQQILRLRYGLDEADGRALSCADIGQLLGITSESVGRTSSRALQKLRVRADPLHGQRQQEARRAKAAKTAQQRSARRQQRQQQAQQAQEAKAAQRRLEQEERVAAACEQLRAQGETITFRALRAATHLNQACIQQFLATRRAPVQERLTAACEQLRAQGKDLTCSTLCQLALVNYQTAGAFLQALHR